MPSRHGVRSPDVLDRLPDAADPGTVSIPRSLIAQLSDGLEIDQRPTGSRMVIRFRLRA